MRSAWYWRCCKLGGLKYLWVLIKKIYIQLSVQNRLRAEAVGISIFCFLSCLLLLMCLISVSLCFVVSQRFIYCQFSAPLSRPSHLHLLHVFIKLSCHYSPHQPPSLSPHCSSVGLYTVSGALPPLSVIVVCGDTHCFCSFLCVVYLFIESLCQSEFLGPTTTKTKTIVH